MRHRQFLVEMKHHACIAPDMSYRESTYPNKGVKGGYVVYSDTVFAVMPFRYCKVSPFMRVAMA